MRNIVFGAVLCLFLSVTAASAGQLFPPANIGSNPNAPCPNNGVLKWTGNSVVCDDPTDGITLACPANQVLTGVKDGRPVCKEAQSSESVDISCPAGQFLRGITGGAPVCEVLPVLNLSCPVGEYLVGIVNGKASCLKDPVCSSSDSAGSYTLLRYYGPSIGLSRVECMIPNPIFGSANVCACPGRANNGAMSLGRKGVTTSQVTRLYLETVICPTSSQNNIDNYSVPWTFGWDNVQTFYGYEVLDKGSGFTRPAPP